MTETQEFLRTDSCGHGTNAQLSSRLAYNAQTPAFLQRLQNRVQGNADSDEEDPEWEEVGGGRPAIPRRPKDERPAIPTRPDDDPGSADEEAGDEAPQIIVLREGKHLSAREVENIKRREKGLPPLPEHEEPPEVDEEQTKAPVEQKKSDKPSLSFSSSKPDRFSELKSQSLGKRKIRITADDEDDYKDAPAPEHKDKSSVKKKQKKQKKTLLSFGDDA